MLALAIGMVVAIAGSTAVAIDPELASVRRVAIVVALVLMAVGYAGIAMQIAGWRRGVVLAIALLVLGWLAWVLARPHVGELSDGGYLALALVWWSNVALLTIAARAWWAPGSPLVVIAAVIAVGLEGLPLVVDLAWPWERPLRELVTSGAILVLARAILK